MTGNSNGVWELIRTKACTADSLLQPHPLYQVYLARQPIHIQPPSAAAASDWEDRHWVIGSYKELQRLATNLRADESLRILFSEAGAAFGRRHTDVPPTELSTGPARFRKDEKKAIKEGKLNPVNLALLKQRVTPGATMDPRRSDLFTPYAQFYSAKTLEAHHIVEKSMLGTLNLNKGAFHDDNAPCVLVVAELHQQLYTPDVSPSRKQIVKGMKHTDAADRLTEIYAGAKPAKPGVLPGLYETPQMAGLLEIANIIIERVRASRTD